jgi:hypothetical protein
LPASQATRTPSGSSQQLGRRRQRDLLAALHRQHRRQRSHNGFAGADIALHQPQHRVRTRKITTDLVEHPLLRAGKTERQ